MLNPLIIKGIFKDEISSLKQVKMCRLALDFGAELLGKFYFDLNIFPISAPNKWLQRKCDTVSFNISLIDSKFTTLSIQGGAIVGDLEIIL